MTRSIVPQEPVVPRLHPTLDVERAIEGSDLRADAILQSVAYYAVEEDWLLLIYIKNNSPKDGIVIEDRTDSEKNISHEFKTTEIFKASDMMVDSLIRLFEKERKKKAS